ncbi:MAG: hypothetical protein H2045_06085 [Rhizobiales bacterium]|nr:hypothetical protein [Hyphomicrobiales bacterium]
MPVAEICRKARISRSPGASVLTLIGGADAGLWLFEKVLLTPAKAVVPLT